MSDKEVMPKGFTLEYGYHNGPDTKGKDLVEEAYRIKSNEDGPMKNVEIYDGSGFGYRVTEETRYMPFTNNSIQSVGAHAGGGVKDYAYLKTEGYFSETMLKAQSDGHVFLIENGKKKDITHELADVGITAAGIRRTQLDIASDGEISRPEQQHIIDLIDKARGL